MSPEDDARRRRNRGLRLAVAVALGLTIEIERGALLPPLAPVIALQLLALVGPPPGPKLVVGLFAIVAAASTLAYAIATLTVGNALLYAIGVGLLYLWGFALAVRPQTAAPGALLLTMAIVVTALSALSTSVAIAIVGELLVSILIGIGLVFAAHAVFPHPPAKAGTGQRGSSGGGEIVLPPAWRAVLATLIILPLHLYLTADGIAALVVLLTVATMLRQPGLTQSVQYGSTFAAGNFLGGLLASMAVLVVSLHPTLPVLVTVVSACALLMAWQLDRSPRLARVLLPGFVAFTLLFGLALSPLALDHDVALLKRVVQIVLGALYALCAISLLAPLAGATSSRPAPGRA